MAGPVPTAEDTTRFQTQDLEVLQPGSDLKDSSLRTSFHDARRCQKSIRRRKVINSPAEPVSFDLRLRQSLFKVIVNERCMLSSVIALFSFDTVCVLGSPLCFGIMASFPFLFCRYLLYLFLSLDRSIDSHILCRI